MATILIKSTKESIKILTVDSEGKQNFLTVNSSEENIKDHNCRAQKKTKVPVCSAKRKIKVPIIGKPRGNMKDPDCGEPRGKQNILSVENLEDKPVCSAKRKIKDPDCGEPRGKILSRESPEDNIKPPDKGQREINQKKTSTIQLMTRKNKNEKRKTL